MLEKYKTHINQFYVDSVDINSDNICQVIRKLLNAQREIERLLSLRSQVDRSAIEFLLSL